ncbi:MAG: Rieske 2Fe-2S domain-containing protein [Vampirovibrio sp.]|nr:Rieske 2Fe-2S domain-containing protein [Vampirovibrio sp.]
MDRRAFLKILFGLPLLGAIGLFISPLVRYLRPSAGPIGETLTKFSFKGSPLEWKGGGGLFSNPDLPVRERDIVFSLDDFPTPWSYQTFTFGQKSREYTFKGFQAINIPGFVVRLPDEGGEKVFHAVSRICPHMGCVFNFLTDPAKAVDYNYPLAKNPLFACPCHFSVFDPLQEGATGTDLGDIRGAVVSGPAPRPPRIFEMDVDTAANKLVVTKVEAGGIS